ncbi:hypothetical protein CONLIGDRAFT_675456 [Coniochaeta ligniaria NRRL 30616]|uniref:Velvet domain-containing protein n=1 Tax=Coniochaeta ligniaria NRRL 30616 TaxID=1408157 RepID=A0A1J7J301_9PEZI|nr:hypothetical protein CONLIGDRAFT_675456 [Coniochaeta ligniaria NRRL 30616]
MPLPPTSYTSGHSVAPLPSLQGQPTAAYVDAYGQVAPSADTPTAPSSASTARDSEVEERSRQNLIPYSSVENGRRYALDVVQQPQRARMCGFGDKDRRPITPPPCVRLIITDVSTGKEVDCNEIEHTMYVLNVDLWSEDATKEVNLVRHTTATPSISSTTQASFGSIESVTPAYAHILPSNRPEYPPQVSYPPTVNPYSVPQGYAAPQYMSPDGYSPAGNYFPNGYRQDMQQLPPHMASPLASQSVAYRPPQQIYDPIGMAQRLSMSAPQPQGMFTRNLIGSLAASAFRLTDPADRIGIWFILQDLSVRTEGHFRLRFSFVNVGLPTMASNGQQVNAGSMVNQGKAPVLASCFSDVFSVYSAKKFPGVCDSTALSKCFASQGIKIPIRKEGASTKGGRDDDDDDD